MSEIEPIHQFAYDGGADPVEHAVYLAQTQIECRNEIRDARWYNHRAYSIFKGDLGDEATARRIVADLLNAGWAPPVIQSAETGSQPNGQQG
jgi:hypothetical protein